MTQCYARSDLIQIIQKYVKLSLALVFIDEIYLYCFTRYNKHINKVWQEHLDANREEVVEAPQFSLVIKGTWVCSMIKLQILCVQLQSNFERSFFLKQNVGKKISRIHCPWSHTRVGQRHVVIGITYRVTISRRLPPFKVSLINYQPIQLVKSWILRLNMCHFR